MTENTAILDNHQSIDTIKEDNLHNTHFVKRIIEALLFSSQTPLSLDEIQTRIPNGYHIDLLKMLRTLQAEYEGRGIEIIDINKKWLIRTAPDLSEYMIRDIIEHKKLTKSALETLGIIAYHQPVTRTEIENIRGVAVSKGSLDHLMKLNWIRLGARRETPGRPVTFITTEGFLNHFALKSLKDLPGLKELKEAGFLDSGGRQVSDEEMRFLLDQQNSEEISETDDASLETNLRFEFEEA